MNDTHEQHHHHDAPAVPIPEDRQASCPVTGDKLDITEAEKLGHYRDVNGKRIYFCCATCVREFDKNPEQYEHHHLGHEHHHHTPMSGMLYLKDKQHLVDNVWAFRFEPGEPLEWIPGQFIRVELEHDNPDEEGTKRWFTISSSPHDDFVQITTRVTDTTFKRALAALQIGGQLQLIERPDGDFVWQDDERSLVFVAGGIGITPYYSILKARGHSGQPVSATLIYNGRDDNLPFREELDEAAKRHPEFTVHYVTGGQLSVEKLAELVPALKLSQVYLSGPEAMVESLGKQLRESGVSEDNLHEDFFPNYSETNY